MTWTWGALLGAALCLPAIVGWAGHWPWGLGLWLGEVLGAVSVVWIRSSVRRALDPAEGAKNPWSLLGHSLLRLVLLGLVFFLALKLRHPVLSIWAVLCGYLLVQLPASLWQRWAFQGRKISS